MQYNENLIVSNGYYTTLVAVSTLKQLGINDSPKYLLGYFKQLSNSIAESINLSEQAWSFKEVFDYNLFFNNKFSFELFSKHCKNIKFCNILIPINSSTIKWYKGLKKYYPNAKFIFYEEGLLSYLKPIFDIKLKKIITKNLCFYNNFNKNLNYLIENGFGIFKKNIHFIKEEIFNNSISDIKKLLNISFNNLNLNQSKNVLFIPQYYNNNNKYLFAQKVQQYLKIINQLLNNGYTVLIKDHPKDKNFSLEKYLKIGLKGNPNIIYLNNINKFPVELFINDLNIDFVFSVYSTTLFSASSSLFKLPVFTSYTMLKDRIKSFSFYPSVSCTLVKSIIPDIENFLNYYKLNSKRYYNSFLYKINNKQHNTISLFIKYLLK